MDAVAESALSIAQADPLEPESRYFNRELSWLAFNRRVLEEASNDRHPLLERVRFLSISANNLDEFFMVRVAGLKAHQALGVEERSMDGRTVAQQLAAITTEADQLVTSQHEVWRGLQTQLDKAGMHVVGEEPLDDAAEAWLDQHFREQIFPVLTPQAIDPAHPFPFIPNRGLSLIFELRKGRTSVRELVMAPASLPRFIRLPGGAGRYIALETLIRCKTDYLFPKYELLRGGAFRIIRDSDIEVEEEAEDLAQYFQTAIKRRRRGRVVRLELEPGMVESLVRVVQEGLDAKKAIIRALIDAAEAGKSVTAVIELKARFDEEQNLMWASALERAGVQVVYGFIDWKTHAKVSMVVRREEKGFCTYCHFGTGNYHPVTARIYTDLSYFTADPRLGRDAAKLFNYITGYLEPKNLKQLVISPQGMRAELIRLVDAEIAAARAKKPSGIWAKMNSLVDPFMIDKLYEASDAGVPIDLVIRGICCLRPGVPGMSENIYVKSIVGRFLEHARVWCFANGHELPHPEAKVYISSADWMPRNFDRRIEYMLPIENPTVHAQLIDQVMVANLIDNEQSWRLNADGTYTWLQPKL